MADSVTNGRREARATGWRDAAEPGRDNNGMDPWVSAFERMSARHWQGTEQAHLGGWLLRAGGGFTGRANSALPLGEPGRPAERAVDEVEAWYWRRGLKPMIVIATGLGGDGDALIICWRGAAGRGGRLRCS